MIKINDLDSREVEALTALKDIDQISKLTESFTWDNKQILVLKYIEGETLSNYIEDNERSLADNLKLVDQIVNIVRSIHKHGWIHGDIHLDNILVSHGYITIIDFGTAVKSITIDNTNIPLYPPPESLILDGSKYVIDPNYRINYQYDNWALGLVLVRLLTDLPVPSASNFMLEEFSASEVIEVYTKWKYDRYLPVKVNLLITGLLTDDPRIRTIYW